MPMLTMLDGCYARSPTEIADRWVEHFSHELGGGPSTFASLSFSTGSSTLPLTVDTFVPPTLDHTFDVILDSKRGRALGPDSAPIELVQIGGLPAASLLHGLVIACWSQNKSPLCWNGGRICQISKSNSFLNAHTNVASLSMINFRRLAAVC